MFIAVPLMQQTLRQEPPTPKDLISLWNPTLLLVFTYIQKVKRLATNRLVITATSRESEIMALKSTIEFYK